MSRFANAGPNVSEWSHATGEGSTTFDLCKKCSRVATRNPHAFDDELEPEGTDEPWGEDGLEGGVEHPPYDELDYTCAVCGHELDERDE